MKPNLVLLGLGLLPGIVLFACATDNGDAVHGDQFGPPPGRIEGGADGPAVVDDGGPSPNPEAGSDGDAPVTTCTSGTVAVLAGGDTTLSGAVQVAGGAWTGAGITGGAAKSAPSLVAFGTGFVGLTRGPSDALQSVTYGASWSAALTVSGATSLGTPALAVVGAKAQGVYLSGNPDPNKFYRTEYGGTAWSAGDLVTAGGNPSFGPSAGTVAAGGADLVFAQSGSDNGLYYRSWSAGAWDVVPTGITGAGTFSSTPPVLVAIDGKFDLVLLYADKTAPYVIGFATRDKVTKVWSSAAVTQPTAQTPEQFSAASISSTGLVVAFRGNNSRPYTMTGTIGATAISWGVPAPLLADSSTVDAAPAVAKGVCGDDAIAVFASAGQVKVTRHRGTSWSVPESVTGASGTRVSVATR